MASRSSRGSGGVLGVKMSARITLQDLPYEVIGLILRYAPRATAHPARIPR